MVTGCRARALPMPATSTANGPALAPPGRPGWPMWRSTKRPARCMCAAWSWGTYPILSFREVPVIEVMHMPRQDEAPLGSGESSSVPGTAAIANAIFDATGVRFRAPPFTPEVVRAGLNPLPGGAGEAAAGSTPPTEQAEVLPTLELPAPTVPASATWPTKRSPWARALALAAGGIAMGAALLGWRPSIAPVVQTAGASVYNAATIERGRLLAAAGDCVVCHTAPGGGPPTTAPGPGTRPRRGG